MDNQRRLANVKMTTRWMLMIAFVSVVVAVAVVRTTEINRAADVQQVKY